MSNRAARVAEEISREKGLTIAKEVKAERKHQKEKASPTREQTKQQVQKICYTLLDKYKGTGVTGHSMFLYELNKNGITIKRMKNKQGKVYGVGSSHTQGNPSRLPKSAGSSATIPCRRTLKQPTRKNQGNHI